MPAAGSPTASVVLRASADTLIATIAGGLVLLVFYPITICAAGVKGLARMIRRPHLTKSPRSVYYPH
jgi:hypothetical protein